jgi:hypothetical protein
MKTNEQDLGLGKDSSLNIKLHYHVGKGAYWGSYDFWTAVVENLVAATIFIPIGVIINILSNKIYETLKGSKSEKDMSESSRFDLLIQEKNNSLIVVRIMRSAQFRTKKKIEKEDIFKAIDKAIDTYKELSNTTPNLPIYVCIELNNRSDEISIDIHHEVNADFSEMYGIKTEIENANSGQLISLKINDSDLQTGNT